MKSGIIICILVSLALISCQSESDPVNPNDNAQGLWDLRVGNSWTYEIVTYRGWQMKDVAVRDTTRLKIVGTKNINGETWYVFNNSNNDTFLYTNRGSSLWQYFEDRGIAGLVHKFPTHVGEVTKRINENYITASVDKMVSTKAGDFKCVQYSRWEGGKFPVDGYADVYCYCPGHGLISYKQMQNIDLASGIPDTLWYEGRLIGTTPN